MTEVENNDKQLVVFFTIDLTFYVYGCQVIAALTTGAVTEQHYKCFLY